MQYFDYRTRVIYRDTDRMGVSYYANYFVWFEAARTEYFRALGLPYTECEKKGIFLPVIEAHAKYIAPSTYDDELIVRTSVSKFTPSTVRFEYVILNAANEKVLTEGYTVHVFVDREMKPCRVPDEVESLVTVHSLIFSKK
ncbi:MAG TPA: thioesterase family protein [Candidatus Omnitrophota bacterium]|nr:hypothetical protein [Candidatus Omnitrophota bacterium]HRK62431.1 thioesterase family protein [Candidatus Omnitrophota bacterium]